MGQIVYQQQRNGNGIVYAPQVPLALVSGTLVAVDVADSMTADGRTGGGVNGALAAVDPADAFAGSGQVQGAVGDPPPAGQVFIVYQQQKNGSGVVYAQQRIVGSEAQQGADTIDALGSLGLVGTLDATLPAQTIAGLAEVVNRATADLAPGGDTITATGVLSGGGGAVGDADLQPVGDTITALGALLITGTGDLYPWGDTIDASSYFASRTGIAQIDPEGDTIDALGTTARFAVLKFRSGLGEVPTPTSFKWAFWDYALPDQLTVPRDTGTGQIGADGRAILYFPNSTLPPGGIGYLVLANTDGNPDRYWKHHSGPVRVQ